MIAQRAAEPGVLVKPSFRKETLVGQDGKQAYRCMTFSHQEPVAIRPVRLAFALAAELDRKLQAILTISGNPLNCAGS